MEFIETIDRNYKKVNIYFNEFNEYVLRCFKNGSHIYEYNYHCIDKNEAITEANLFLNKN
jgi:putative ribosome biogenesis GTPase RsgA